MYVLAQPQSYLKLDACATAVRPVLLEIDRLAPKQVPHIYYHVHQPRSGRAKPSFYKRIHRSVPHRFYCLVGGKEVVVSGEIRQSANLPAVVTFLFSHFSLLLILLWNVIGTWFVRANSRSFTTFILRFTDGCILPSPFGLRRLRFSSRCSR